MGTPEKNPAAVALGKRRQAQMTPEERAQFVSAGTEAARKTNSRRTPEEHRRIARLAAQSRRMRPKWMKTAAGSPGEPPAPAASLAQLAREIDAMPDELLKELASALAGR